MKISVIGTGYVGLVTGTCFSEMGNKVYCVDNDREKIEKLGEGIIPIYEPGLEEMVKRNTAEGNLIFTTSLEEAIKETPVCFIAVGTPMDEDGSADLQYVLGVAQEIGKYMTREMIIVDKSTVPVGTADKVAETIGSELKSRGVDLKFTVISIPEFLKEGSAVADCMSPDRVVIGSPDKDVTDVIKDLYSPFVRNSDRFVVMDVRSAEMTKYAANAMLATRISFMNEIATLCEAANADINMVRLGIGSDSRIGYSFLYAGCGYGGSCFPKDVQALIKTAGDYGCPAGILKQVEAVNTRQKTVLIDKIVKHFGKDDLTGLRFAIWGLAFKPNTDDCREAPALTIITELLKRGATVAAYDPKATDEFKHMIKCSDGITYEKSKYSALVDADAMLLVTEWKEFRSPDFEEMKMRMKTPVIFDGRNQYSSKAIAKLGFRYHQIGSGSRA